MNFKASSAVSPWVAISRSKEESQGRLVCLPFAGGGATAYHRWIGRVSAGIDLVRIKLPGREDRLGEPLFTHLPSLVETLAGELPPWIHSRPFAVFGHSMGALMAFELARELRRRHGVLPTRLFVSGCQAPHLPNSIPSISGLPDADFIVGVSRYGGIPDFVTQNEELVEIFLPILKADFRMMETYVYRADRPLECPLTAFGGLSDPKIDREKIFAWRMHTSMQFSAHFFPGGHFFLHDSEPLILRQINLQLSESLLTQAAGSRGGPKAGN